MDVELSLPLLACNFQDKNILYLDSTRQSHNILKMKCEENYYVSCRKYHLEI